MSQHEDDDAIVKNVRRTTGISALRKIGKIVAEDLQVDAEKEKALRWLARYGWMVLLAGALLLAYLLGVV